MELAPLFALLNKKSDLEWTEDCEKCFRKAKTIMSADTILAHYDANKELRIACACMNGVGRL